MVGVPQMCDPYHGLRLMRVVGRVHMFWARVCDTPLMAVVARALPCMARPNGGCQCFPAAAVSARGFSASCTCVVRVRTDPMRREFCQLSYKDSPSLKTGTRIFVLQRFHGPRMTACIRALLWGPGVFCCLLCFGVVLGRRRCLHRNI